MSISFVLSKLDAIFFTKCDITKILCIHYTYSLFLVPPLSVSRRNMRDKRMSPHKCLVSILC